MSSPIDAVLDNLRSAFVERRRDAEARADRLRTLTEQYLRAAEEDLAADIAERTGLSAPSERRVIVALRAIRAEVDSLSEVAQPDAIAPRESIDEVVADAAVGDDRSDSATEFETLYHEFSSVDLEGAANEVFRAWAEEFACRVRQLQERRSPDDLDLAGRIMRKLTALQRERNAGFVFGLAREHVGDWSVRIQRARQARESSVNGRQDARRNIAAKIVIPDAVREQVAAANDDEDDEVDLDTEKYPRLTSVVRETGLVLVGGIVKRVKLSRLQRAFGESVEWIATDGGGTNAVASLEQRVRSRSVGAVVVLNGVLGHKHYDVLVDAARTSNVPFGYGWRGGKASLDEAFREIELCLARVG